MAYGFINNTDTLAVHNPGWKPLQEKWRSIRMFGNRFKFVLKSGAVSWVLNDSVGLSGSTLPQKKVHLPSLLLVNMALRNCITTHSCRFPLRTYETNTFKFFKKLESHGNRDRNQNERRVPVPNGWTPIRQLSFLLSQGRFLFWWNHSGHPKEKVRRDVWGWMSFFWINLYHPSTHWRFVYPIHELVNSFTNLTRILCRESWTR